MTTLMLLQLAVGHLQPVVVVETVWVHFLSISHPSTVLVTAHGSGQGSVVVVGHGTLTVAVIVPVSVIVVVFVTVTGGRMMVE